MVQSLHTMIDNENMNMADAEKFAETGILPEKKNTREKTFADLGLSDEILKAVETKGYTTPSAIQAGVIPYFSMGTKTSLGRHKQGQGKQLPLPYLY